MIKKYILFAAVSLFVCMAANAQSGTNSPYSQYGIGELANKGTGAARGMNNVGVAFHDGNRVNVLNPASYAGIDSITFLFDAGMNLQISSFSEGAGKVTARNADIDYAVGGFRIIRNLGLAFGVLPVSNIGYSYYSESPLVAYDPDETNANYNSNTVFSGSGGLHEGFIGLGYSPFKNFSVGFNYGYLWGTALRGVATSYSDTYVNTLAKLYSYKVSSYNLNLGMQYSFKVSKADEVSLGVNYTLGHNLGANPELLVASASTMDGVADTTTYTAPNGIDMPHMINVGVAFSHGRKWRVGFDYSLEKWASAKYPKSFVSSVFDDLTQSYHDEYSYTAVTNYYNDRQKFNLGGEYCQNEVGRSFLSRIRFRAGISYATPYLKIYNKAAKAYVDGPSEYSASVGFGIPILNGYNSGSRHFSMVNISAQYSRTSMKDAITDNSFRINIGLTFNERWFAKWKFE